MINFGLSFVKILKPIWHKANNFNFYFKPLCFSCLFPSLPPHTLAAATNTPNAKSTLQAGWHKRSTILAHASLCRGILSETLWHIQASLPSSWGPCLSQSHQQQGALTVNVLPVSSRSDQIKRLHFASVHPLPSSHPQKSAFAISVQQWRGIAAAKTQDANRCNLSKNKKKNAGWANSCNYSWLDRTLGLKWSKRMAFFYLLSMKPSVSWRKIRNTEGFCWPCQDSN